MKKGIFIIVLAVVAMACNSRESQTANGNEAVAPKTDSVMPKSDLLGSQWKLLELKGKAIVLDTAFKKEPYVVFEKDNRLSGNLGCNSFGGNFKLKDKNGIEISEIIATQMACPNLAIEQEFSEVLRNAKGFRIESDKLFLSNQKQETTALLILKK